MALSGGTRRLAFGTRRYSGRGSLSRVYGSSDKKEKATEENAEPGSDEAPAPPDTQYDVKYYTGMLNSPLSADDRSKQLSENRDGLKQNLKLVSFAALGIGALFIAFMASNGLI